MGNIKYVGALLMTALFAVSIIVFSIGFGQENTAAFNLGDSEGFNDTRDSIQNNLVQYRTDVINSSNSFYESEISEGETVRTGGQFKVGPFTAYSAAKSTISQSFTTIFGKGAEFAYLLTALLGFLSFVLILYIWKTWAGRNPD